MRGFRKSRIGAAIASLALLAPAANQAPMGNANAPVTVQASTQSSSNNGAQAQTGSSSNVSSQAFLRSSNARTLVGNSGRPWPWWVAANKRSPLYSSKVMRQRRGAR